MSAERRHRFRAHSDRKLYWRPRESVDEWREATLLDISTSGARVRSVSAPIHHYLAVAVRLDDSGILLSAELVRIEAQLETGEFVWAITFRDVGADDQMRLMRFVFAEAKREQAGLPAA